MLNKLALFMVAALAINAQASVKVDYRQDLKTVTTDEKSSTPGYGAFQAQTLRVDMKGNINDSLSARARFKLNKNDQAATKNEKLSDFVDYAYINNKMSDSLTIRYGKMFSEIGGTEALSSSADMYLVSNTFNNHALYLSGINAMYKMGDNQFQFLALNQPTDILKSSKANQKALMTGIVYSGSFMDKMIQPKVSYHTAGRPDLGTDSKSNFIAVGAKFDLGTYSIDFDQLMNTWVKSTSAGALATKDDSSTEMVVTARMKGDNWSPTFKYVSRADKAQDVDSDKYASMGLAAEYVPVKGEDFRYHLAYNSITKTTAADVKTTDTEIYLGVRLAMDVLK